ncbi:MAG TPA: glycine cleavage system protein GcvH [Rhizobiales bacterium]|nr:glycine cleavage system protein GcvH [Hyphomicrobiales bacterium]
MSDTKYTEEHEYIQVDGDTATIGITDYAQEQLGDVVFVELPEVGASFEKGDEAAVIESVKAASELYAPISCAVVEINEVLEGEPAIVNSDPEGAGWFMKVTISDAAQLDELMDEDAYKTFIAEL